MEPLLNVPGLEPRQHDALNDAVRLLGRKTLRNQLRGRYDDSKQIIKHLGIAIPPHLERIETLAGLPTLAVDKLNDRINLHGMVLPGADPDAYDLAEMWDENHLDGEAPPTHRNALKYSTSFLSVLEGDEQVGQPKAMIQPVSAITATGLWDSRRRALRAGLAVTKTRLGKVAGFVLYLPDTVITAWVNAFGRWEVENRPHDLAEVPLIPMPAHPDLERPFGKSRITRPVMALTDSAIRTLLRQEVSAEFYSAPQRYILGADESAFMSSDGQQRTGWEVSIGRVLALPTPEDGETPTVGAFAQQSMQPHTDHLRSIMAMFSAETSIPVGTLGVIHDNPSSDAAMHTAYLDLNKHAERAFPAFGRAWVKAHQLGYRIRSGRSEIPEELKRLRARWSDPATPTMQARTDSALKLVSAGILPARSRVALEYLGFDDVEIERIEDEWRRGSVTDLIANVRGAAGSATQDPTVAALAAERGGQDPLKDRAVALGALVRSGVESSNAAQAVGLGGLKFTGATPVALRPTESQAANLEGK